MTVTPGTAVEFSRKLRLDRLAGGRIERQLEANAEECAALAERFGLVALDGLRGTVTVIRPTDTPLVRVEGELAADVQQTCVVTLAPFTARVEDSFVQLFTLEEAPDAASGEVFVAVDEDDTPEPLDGDSIDLGEVLAEQLALALDPHPRAPGVAFEGATFGQSNGGAGNNEHSSEEDEAENPFAVLKRLKREE